MDPCRYRKLITLAAFAQIPAPGGGPLAGRNGPGLVQLALNRSTTRLGAVLRQAAASARRATALWAAVRRTLVEPWRPHAPATGAKAAGQAPTKLCCSSGVSFTMAQPFNTQLNEGASGGVRIAQESDRQLIDWLRAAGREFAVVATKVDRLSGNERTRNLTALKQGLELDEVLAVSAKTGYGVKELWARIEAAGGQPE